MNAEKEKKWLGPGAAYVALPALLNRRDVCVHMYIQIPEISKRSFARRLRKGALVFVIGNSPRANRFY